MAFTSSFSPLLSAFVPSCLRNNSQGKRRGVCKLDNQYGTLINKGHLFKWREKEQVLTIYCSLHCLANILQYVTLL